MADGQFAFSCPNGHQLNGPANLQGQPGQCPKCGVKFIIPTSDGSEAWDDGSFATSQAHFDDDEMISMSDLDRISPFGSANSGVTDSGSFGVHAMEQLFAILWREREHGGVVEVHLDNFVIVPDWWAESLSSSTHAVFALQTADGTYVIEAVSWDSIRRITVRRITELPDGVFQ